MRESTIKERFIVSIIGKIRKKIENSRLLQSEEALVVSWMDVVTTLCLTALLFVLLGPMMDAGWTYMNHAPAGFYTTSDIETSNKLYDFFRFIPLIALGVVVYYVINYSNMRKGD
jgi:hypothetical protein